MSAMLAVSAVGVPNAGAQSKEERAIRAIIDRHVQINSSVDPTVIKQGMNDLGAGPFYPLFTESVGSAAELEPMMDQMLSTVSARSFTVTSPIAIHAEKNLGWANYTWRADITFKDGNKRSFEGRTTIGFERQGKDWKAAHWQSSLVAPMPLSGKELEAEQQNIIQKERDAWEAYKNKQIDAFNDYYADDATAFNDDQAYRIKGKADILRGMEAEMKQADVLSYQILDPEVRIVGDTALLTYYYTYTATKDGKTSDSSGKFTIVFVKQGGKWRAIHEHMAANVSPRRMNRP